MISKYLPEPSGVSRAAYHLPPTYVYKPEISTYLSSHSFVSMVYAEMAYLI